MSTVTSLPEPRRSRKLDPEPWGARIARARKAAGFGDTRALDGAKHILGFGRGPVNVLEQHDQTPTEPALRRRAYMLLSFYDFDPADFGLGDDDRPPAIDLDALSDLGRSPTTWYEDAVAA